ncbi:hypothetical protein OK016_12260 [Vibrio chagasii]|nr:hypothetical protein [Vibrio chagasii]
MASKKLSGAKGLFHRDLIRLAIVLYKHAHHYSYLLKPTFEPTLLLASIEVLFDS